MFDDGYFFCLVEQVLFASRCGPGDPAQGDATGGCHHNVTSFRLTDYDPLVADTCTGNVPAAGSITETAAALREAGLLVKDAFVLVDLQHGAKERLKADGINLRAVLTLEVILNYLMSSGLIEEEQYRRSMEYLEAGRS